MILNDIWEDICWYVWDWPKKVKRDIMNWILTCGKYKSHWKFVWYCCFHCYPWDKDFMIKTQYYWLKKSQEYFNNRCYCSEDKLNEINRYQRICIGLIEIMLDIRDYWDYDMKSKKVIMKIPYNLKNKERFPYKGIDANGKECMATDIYENFPDEYYKYKARYLYYKILKNYSDNWWD